MRGVFMLVNEFPPLPVGGAERQAERLSRYLAAQGLEITVLTRGGNDLPVSEKIDGDQVLRVKPIGPGKLKSLTFVIGAILTLWQQRSHYQVLHAHLAFGPAFAAALVGRILGKAVIVKFGNSGAFGDIQVSQKTWRGRLRLALLRRWADALITLDAVMQAEVLSAGFANSQVRRMPNGIDAQSYLPCRDQHARRAEIRPTELSLVYTGRLSPQKSLDTLLHAVALAVSQYAHMRLVIVGEGPERQALEKLTQDLGISNIVTFTGAVNDVNPYLSAADIFVLPSLAEGISNSLLEAMASGLACIATRVGGTPEVLGTAGILIEPNDVERLATELLNLANNPSEIARMGSLAYQRILNEYDFSSVGQRYLKLYEELAKLRSSRVLNEAAS